METDQDLDFGVLCRFCDHDRYELPDVEGLPSAQRELIEQLCKLCLEGGRSAVNS